MTMGTTQIFREYIHVLGNNTQHNGHFSKLGGVVLYALPLHLLDVMNTNPMVVFILNSIELILDEGFKHLPHSYSRITLQHMYLELAFPPSLVLDLYHWFYKCYLFSLILCYGPSNIFLIFATIDSTKQHHSQIDRS